MNRYLLNFSYIGTKFSGVAKIKNHINKAQLSVQENIEDALQKLEPKPVKPIELFISSRTDAGVHALDTTAHIDLEREDGRLYDPITIVTKLNQTFGLWKEPIRILNARLVQPHFSARRDAINRTYLYRLAVRRNRDDNSTSKKQRFFNSFIPIEEQRRCHFIFNKGFDIDRAKEVAEMITGVHDFRTFMNTSHEGRTHHPFFARREMKSISIRPGRTIVTPDSYEKTVAEFDFWEFEFNAKTYIYRQIRKTMSALIGAAERKISKRDVYEMLTIPSKHSWIPSIPMAPGHGLYLKNVEYRAESLEPPSIHSNVNLFESVNKME